uniref:protein-tyrosine-phosphatase n=1 Tax=Crassostrea virginica TaxID=6565 RepID=A0A8B8B065_CRAVI|nr:receptor-type tyrosine-protein phosphatase alpha-like isoform X2 [Crassostrea virginica]
MEFTKLFKFLVDCCLLMIIICKTGIRAAVIIEAHQSSTNGSFEADLACDGDLDTFSLTNDGWNQSWTATLVNKSYDIVWIFVRIEADTFRLTMEVDNAKPFTCVDLTKPAEERTGITEKILTCPELFKSINKIKIFNTGEGALKVFEFKIMGVSQSNLWYTNFTGFPDYSFVLDNNHVTFYQPDGQTDQSWFLRLNSIYQMKWILLSIRGGNYEFHITKDDELTDETTLCGKLSLPGLKQYYEAAECYRAMLGDTIVIKSTADTYMRLFEVYPIICSPNHYGPSCARCRKQCQTCDSITGRCTLCPVSFYGEECQYSCPQYCFNLTCNHTTGTCDSCQDGYKGQRCELQITTVVISTETYSIPHPFITIEDKTTTKRTDVFSTNRKPGDDDYYWALLSCMLVLLTILVFVVIILFSKRTLIRLYKQRGVFGDDQHGDIGVLSEHQQEMDNSANGLELEEIPQNEIGDIEEEVITVEYVNLTTQRVPVGQFLEDLSNRKDEGILENEFDELPYGLLESYSNALKSSNRNKSRYKGIFPYDHNGVKLDTEYENNEGFVNASYIHGYNKEKAYIAAQGPFNPRTLEDFWGMIWQNNSSRIVMLTSLYEGDRMKCLKYWPDIDHTVNFGPYSITLTTQEVYDSYTLRTISLKYEDDVKTVTQFHFTTWLDNSVPEDVTSLINFRNLVRSNLDTGEGPIVVHCSAGIGRTGTFIALDYILEEGATEQTVDVKGYVISLRHQRGKSIQTREQYVFLHDAVAEGLTQNNVYQRGLDVL